jgi:hypothetical protein
MITSRKVPVGRLHATGKMIGFSNNPIELEGPLEKDFVLLNKFDPLVLDIKSQPFTVRYEHPSGRTYNCTPDFLVTRWIGPVDDRVVQKIVYEVKTQKRAEPSDPTFAARFRAVAKHCRLIAAEHKIATERDIRIPRLKNAKLLLPYAHAPISGKVYTAARQICMTKSGVQFGELVKKIRAEIGSDENRIASLYRMLLNRDLAWKWDEALTNDSLIYDWDTWPN